MYYTIDLRFDRPKENDLNKEVFMFVHYSCVTNNELTCITGYINHEGRFTGRDGDLIKEYVHCWSIIPRLTLKLKVG
jgi:hypothetical protein